MSEVDVFERLELSDNFNRWRFLQNMLDAEVTAADANQVVYMVLDSFLCNQSLDSGSSLDESASPRATGEARRIVEGLIKSSNTGQISVFADPDCSPGSEAVLAKLEQLLPDPQENEDAHKGTWDTLIELHGREAVKINEMKGLRDWRALCLVGRVLIYFDFLTMGINPRLPS